MPGPCLCIAFCIILCPMIALLALLYLVLIAEAEVVTAFVSPWAGIACHAVILAALLVHSSFLAAKAQRNLLLSLTLAHLKRLASAGPVIVGAREPRALVKDRWTLLDQLQLAADSAWLLRAPEDTELVQPKLL